MYMYIVKYVHIFDIVWTQKFYSNKALDNDRKALYKNYAYCPSADSLPWGPLFFKIQIYILENQYLEKLKSKCHNEIYHSLWEIYINVSEFLHLGTLRPAFYLNMTCPYIRFYSKIIMSINLAFHSLWEIYINVSEFADCDRIVISHVNPVKSNYGCNMCK
jgi:hypothetical protein